MYHELNEAKAGFNLIGQFIMIATLGRKSGMATSTPRDICRQASKDGIGICTVLLSVFFWSI